MTSGKSQLTNDKWFLPFAFACLAVSLHAEQSDSLSASQKFFSSLDTFACDIDLLRVERTPGKVSERRAHFEVAFKRPNLLSVLLKDEGSVNYAWICDGKNVFTYIAGLEKYSKENSPATLAEVLASTEIYVVRNTLEGAFIVDELFAPSAGERLPGKARSVEFVAAEELDTGKVKEPAQHLRFKRDAGDWDVWLASGTAPAPLRVHGELPPDPQAPARKVEFTVEFKNALFGAALDARAFQFDKESKAKRASGFLPDIPPHELTNHPAPAATLSLPGGQSKTLASHRGRDVVVLDFWAISCVPCMGTMPKVDAVAKKFAGKNVAFYAMNENDSPEDVQEFLKLKNISVTPTFRNKAANFAAFRVDVIPMIFVIDKNGTIRAVHTVHSNDLTGELTTLIESLLKE